MEFVLRQLYYKRKTIFLKEGSIYKKNLNELIKLNKEFEKQLTTKQKQLFDKIDNLYSDMEEEIAAESYADGLKLGIRIGIETMQE